MYALMSRLYKKSMASLLLRELNTEWLLSKVHLRPFVCSVFLFLVPRENPIFMNWPFICARFLIHSMEFHRRIFHYKNLPINMLIPKSNCIARAWFLYRFLRLDFELIMSLIFVESFQIAKVFWKMLSNIIAK